MKQVVQVPCKRCKRQVESSKLVLDPMYKMMVCPQCSQEAKIKSPKPIVTEIIPDNTIQSEKVKVACKKCTYKFMFNPQTKVPTVCPYCGSKVA